MKNPSNYDLAVMIARLEEQLKPIVKMGEDTVEWQKEHERKDELRFANLNKYAASVAIVSSFIGAGCTWLYEKMTGKI